MYGFSEVVVLVGTDCGEGVGNQNAYRRMSEIVLGSKNIPSPQICIPEIWLFCVRKLHLYEKFIRDKLINGFIAR